MDKSQDETGRHFGDSLFIMRGQEQDGIGGGISANDCIHWYCHLCPLVSVPLRFEK
jgi:hypothetical protein